MQFQDKYQKVCLSITNRITKSFSNIGKGNNIFSRISNGVKNLYNKAKTNFGNTFGKKAKCR